MNPKVAIGFTEGLFDTKQLDVLKEQLSASGVDLEVFESKPVITASVRDFIIAHLNLSDEFWNDLVTDVAKEALKKFVVEIWKLVKPKYINQISARTHRLIRKHYLEIPRKIEDKKHWQYFLISNKLEVEVIDKGFGSLSKASKKFAQKSPINDWPFREDYIRLKKDGKWKRIKDMSAFRTKLVEKNKRDDKPID